MFDKLLKDNSDVIDTEAMIDSKLSFNENFSEHKAKILPNINPDSDWNIKRLYDAYLSDFERYNNSVSYSQLSRNEKLEGEKTKVINMNEMELIEERKKLWHNDCFLYVDSLTGDTINVDFEALNFNILKRLQAYNQRIVNKRLQREQQEITIENGIINSLMNGQKIISMGNFLAVRG